MTQSTYHRRFFVATEKILKQRVSSYFDIIYYWVYKASVKYAVSVCLHVCFLANIYSQTKVFECLYALFLTNYDIYALI